MKIDLTKEEIIHIRNLYGKQPGSFKDATGTSDYTPALVYDKFVAACSKLNSIKYLQDEIEKLAKQLKEIEESL